MTDANIIPFDATFVEDLSAPLSETEIATQSIAQLTARLKGADTIAQQLQHVINTDIATKFGMVLESDDRQWFNITKKDLVGDTSDYATSWKHCRKQFTDQRKADGSTNVTMDFTRLQEKGRKIAEDADIAERVAAGETIEDTGSEVKSKGANTNKERDFDVRFLEDLKGLIGAYNRAIEKESEDGFDFVSQAHRDLVDQYVKPCYEILKAE